MFFLGKFRIHYPSQIAILMLLFITAALRAQNADDKAVDEPTRHPAIQAKLLIGLPGIDSGSYGDLSFNSRTLQFTTRDASFKVAKVNILSVSDGDEQVELGGVAGKFARTAIPYGGGYVLGAVAHKKVGLLTMEFVDASGQYHGAVFLMKSQDSAAVISALSLKVVARATPQPVTAPACSASEQTLNTVKVETISADAPSSFPSEDRVLLYERLVERLQSEKSIEHVYRSGDQSSQAQCAAFSIKVSPMAFTKGNQALRASVGPLGHFVGTTKLSYHLTITTRDGTSLFDDDLKKSEGADSDSLNITKFVSKTVVKDLRRSQSHLRKGQAAQAI
ncbi:hypothetical protein [Granulicella arctica]|uniref:hypothetical protein n=1 Tax=Granulicella arctica TaxID=940613 RepID=UPI0021E01FBF|nr:hypothetical protein [Granulicella arctica]